MTEINENTYKNTLNDYAIVYIDDEILNEISLKVIEENDEAYKELAK